MEPLTAGHVGEVRGLDALGEERLGHAARRCRAGAEQPRGEVRRRVEVHRQDAAPLQREARGQVRRKRGLAGAALARGDSDGSHKLA